MKLLMDDFGFELPKNTPPPHTHTQIGASYVVHSVRPTFFHRKQTRWYPQEIQKLVSTYQLPEPPGEGIFLSSQNSKCQVLAKLQFLDQGAFLTTLKYGILGFLNTKSSHSKSGHPIGFFILNLILSDLAILCRFGL